MPDAKEITCPRCNHTWRTKSKLIWVSCPSCQYKIRNPYAEISLAPAHRRAKKTIII